MKAFSETLVFYFWKNLKRSWIFIVFCFWKTLNEFWGLFMSFFKKFERMPGLFEASSVFICNNLKEFSEPFVFCVWKNLLKILRALSVVFERIWTNLRDSWCFVFQQMGFKVSLFARIWMNFRSSLCFVFEKNLRRSWLLLVFERVWKEFWRLLKSLFQEIERNFVVPFFLKEFEQIPGFPGVVFLY